MIGTESCLQSGRIERRQHSELHSNARVLGYLARIVRTYCIKITLAQRAKQGPLSCTRDRASLYHQIKNAGNHAIADARVFRGVVRLCSVALGSLLPIVHR